MLLDVKTGSREFVHNIPGCRAIALSHDGKKIAIGSEHNERYDLLVFDVDSGETICKSKIHNKQNISSLSFSPDGNYLIVGGKYLGCIIFDIKSGEQISAIY